MPHDHDVSGPESSQTSARPAREGNSGVSSDALSLLDLQAMAGNQAVSRLLRNKGVAASKPPSSDRPLNVQRDGLEDSLRTLSGNTTIDWNDFAQRLLTIVNRGGSQTGSSTQSGSDSGSGSTSSSGSGSSGLGSAPAHAPTPEERQLWAAQEENEMRRLRGQDPLPLPTVPTRGGTGGRPGSTTPRPGTTPTTTTGPAPTTGNAPTTTTGTTPTTSNAPTTTAGTTPTTGTAPTTTETTPTDTGNERPGSGSTSGTLDNALNGNDDWWLRLLEL